MYAAPVYAQSDLRGMADSSVLVFRSLGVGTPAQVDEYAGGSAAALQSVSIRTATLPGCFVNPTPNQAYGGSSADGQYALFTCGLSSNTARPIMRIDGGGALDFLTTSYNAQVTQALPRGITSMDGVTLYEADAWCITKSAYGSSTQTNLNCVDYYYGNVAYSFGGVPTLLTMGCPSSTIPCATTSMYYSTPALPTVTSNTYNLVINPLAFRKAARSSSRPPSLSTLAATRQVRTAASASSLVLPRRQLSSRAPTGDRV